MKRLPLDLSVKEIDIYVIKSEISDEIYVWKISHGGCYQAYKDHARGQFRCTSPLFKRSEEKSKYPLMFLLEALQTTDQMAFRHCIAWTRYFAQHGFQPLANNAVTAYINDLQEETLALYEEIKGLPIDQILSDKRLIVQDYKKKKRAIQSKNEEIIPVYFGKKDCRIVREKARKAGLTASQYCKNMTMTGQSTPLEMPPVWEYTQALLQVKIVLKQILMAIYQNGRYYPADLENIQKLIDRVSDNREEVQKTLLQYIAEVSKLKQK